MFPPTQIPPEQPQVNRRLHLQLWPMPLDTLHQLRQVHLFPMEKLTVHLHPILHTQAYLSTRHQWKIS